MNTLRLLTCTIIATSMAFCTARAGQTGFRPQPGPMEVPSGGSTGGTGSGTGGGTGAGTGAGGAAGQAVRTGLIATGQALTGPPVAWVQSGMRLDWQRYGIWERYGTTSNVYGYYLLIWDNPTYSVTVLTPYKLENGVTTFWYARYEYLDKAHPLDTAWWKLLNKGNAVFGVDAAGNAVGSWAMFETTLGWGYPYAENVNGPVWCHLALMRS